MSAITYTLEIRQAKIRNNKDASWEVNHLNTLNLTTLYIHTYIVLFFLLELYATDYIVYYLS